MRIIDFNGTERMLAISPTVGREEERQCSLLPHICKYLYEDVHVGRSLHLMR